VIHPLAASKIQGWRFCRRVGGLCIFSEVSVFGEFFRLLSTVFKIEVFEVEKLYILGMVGVGRSFGNHSSAALQLMASWSLLIYTAHLQLGLPPSVQRLSSLSREFMNG